MLLCNRAGVRTISGILMLSFSALSTADLANRGEAARADEALYLAKGEVGDGGGEPVRPSPFGQQDLTGNLPLKLAIGLGAVLVSSSLDDSGERFGRRHGDGKLARGMTQVGNALPVVALGVAGAAAFASDDPRLRRTGVASLQAGGGAVLGTVGLKYVIGRARPDTGAGPGSFDPFRGGDSNSSMPSGHTAAIWGAVTPFAKEYDAPWLYGVAALTNYARVADRKHWVSDTVAGSLIGYFLGDIAWRWNRSATGTSSQVYVSPNGVAFNWPLR